MITSPFLRVFVVFKLGIPGPQYTGWIQVGTCWDYCRNNEGVIEFFMTIALCFFGCFLQSSLSWWFQTCFIFHHIWDNPSHWLSYFSGWLVNHQPVIIIDEILQSFRSNPGKLHVSLGWITISAANKNYFLLVKSPCLLVKPSKTLLLSVESAWIRHLRWSDSDLHSSNRFKSSISATEIPICGWLKTPWTKARPRCARRRIARRERPGRRPDVLRLHADPAADATLPETMLGRNGVLRNAGRSWG